MFRRLFGGSKFLKKMNTLMELYSCSHNAPSTYQQLLDLKLKMLEDVKHAG